MFCYLKTDFVIVWIIFFPVKNKINLLIKLKTTVTVPSSNLLARRKITDILFVSVDSVGKL